MAFQSQLINTLGGETKLIHFEEQVSVNWTPSLPDLIDKVTSKLTYFKEWIVIHIAIKQKCNVQNDVGKCVILKQ